MQMCHRKFGYGIHQSVRLIKELVNNFTLCLEPIVVILSEFLLECHANCYDLILDLCQHFVGRNINPYVWSMLQFSVLSIFTYSSKMETTIIKIVECIPRPSSSSLLKISSNKYFQYAIRSEVSVKVALATTTVADSLEENPGNWCTRKCPQPDAVFLLKCAVFWRFNEPVALQDGIQHVSSTKKFANPMLTFLLKKLTLASSGKTKLAILYSLPQLAVDKVQFLPFQMTFVSCQIFVFHFLLLLLLILRIDLRPSSASDFGSLVCQQGIATGACPASNRIVEGGGSGLSVPGENDVLRSSPDRRNAHRQGFCHRRCLLPKVIVPFFSNLPMFLNTSISSHLVVTTGRRNTDRNYCRPFQVC